MLTIEAMLAAAVLASMPVQLPPRIDRSAGQPASAQQVGRAEQTLWTIEPE